MGTEITDEELIFSILGKKLKSN